MKEIVQDLKDISDSKEVMLSNPHPFVIIFIYLLIGIIGTGLIWSYVGKIDEYVKANGIVRPEERISTIKNKITGRVDKVYYEEGMRVKKGDLLYIIDYSRFRSEKNLLENQIEKTSIELENMKLLRESIIEESNLFDPEDENQSLYFSKYQRYIIDLELESRNVQNSTHKYRETTRAISLLTTLESSILEEEDRFSDQENIYYTKYLDYTYNMKKYNNIIEIEEKSINVSEILYEAGAISLKELEDNKHNLNTLKLDRDKYKNQFLLSVRNELEQQINIAKELEASPYLFGVGGNKAVIERYKNNMLLELGTNIEATEAKLENLNSNLSIINMQIEECYVKAPIEGIVNVNIQVNEHDLLQTGEEVATIIPDTDEFYIVQIFVSNRDISKINIGDKVRYNFQALPFREFGEISGKIVIIGTDTRVNQQSGVGYYVVEASVQNREILSHRGEKAEIKVGMATEAQIISGSKRILHWLLEKIDLKD